MNTLPPSMAIILKLVNHCYTELALCMLAKTGIFRNWGLKAIAHKKTILILILKTFLNQIQNLFLHTSNSWVFSSLKWWMLNLNNSVNISTSGVIRWKPLFEERLHLCEKKLYEAIPTLYLHTPNLPFQQTKVMQAGFINILAVSISKISGLNQPSPDLDFDYFQTPPTYGPPWLFHNSFLTWA